jgi:RNA polymerase sigma-E/F/G factor
MSASQDPEASLRALAAEVKRVAPFRRGEEERLVDRIGDRDPSARERLMEGNLPMVMRLARERAGRGLSVGDLFQEGCVGLLAAIRDFPGSGESHFDRFAEARVGGTMDAALGGEAAQLEQERLLVQAAEDFDRTELRLARELKRKPSAAEIGRALEWSEERTEYVRQLVEDARRRHDEEILAYVDEAEIEPAPGLEEDGADKSA